MSTLGAVIAANMRAERARRQWRQKDLADRLGWSVAKVGDLESGRRRIQADHLPDLCRAFEVGLAGLTAGADPADAAALRL